jgi:hypothetical protein
VALAAEGHEHLALALAARDLHRWLQQSLEEGAELTTEQQLEVVDAIVRIRIEADLQEKAPAINPMPRVCILAPEGGVESQAGEALAAGYQIEVLRQPGEFLRSLRVDPPDMVVLDLEAPFTPEEIPAFMNRIQEGQARTLPVASFPSTPIWKPAWGRSAPRASPSSRNPWTSWPCWTAWISSTSTSCRSPSAR